MVALLLLIEFDRLSFYYYTTPVSIQSANQSVSVPRLARTSEQHIHIYVILKVYLKKLN
jgi:hypothetical protein